MAVLVTGAAGFVGSHLTERLIAMGREVVGVDDFNDYYDPAIKRRNLQAVATKPAFHLEPVDFTDEAALESVFARHPIERVVHLGARAGVRPSLLDPLLYERVNVRGTTHLLEECRQHGVERLIFASSSSVYGAHAEVPFREDDPADRPISPYAATKRAAELICHTYHHLYGLPVTCLRLFTVYGPRQRPDLAINRFTRAIHAGAPITMYGDGHSARDYTFVSDIVDGFVAALDAEPALGYEIINLGNSSPVPLTALIEHIEHALGREAVIHHEPDQPGDVPRTYASIEKAERVLGWRPRVPIEEGIRRYVAWFLEREGDTAASPAVAR